MNNINKKHLISTLVAVVLMFVWIFVTVFLTGGRETSQFTDRDTTIFTGFIIVELLTVAVMVFSARKVLKNPPPVIKNNTDKPTDKRRGLLTAVSLIAVIATMFGGISVRSAFADWSDNTIIVIVCIACILPILFLILNIAANHIYNRKLNARPIDEAQDFLISHRINPEKTTAKKVSLLKKIIIINDFYTILLAGCAFVAAFFFGVINDGGDIVGALWICCLVISAAVFRIRLKPSESFFDEDKTYVSESDYPYIYSLARKAAAATGCTDKIRIAILDNFNAGAARINNTISIQLGVLLLNSLSESEVYCVLLHEFSHIKYELKKEKINNHYNYICGVYTNNITNIFSSLTRHMFTFIDNLFNEHYMLYSYSVSLTRETDADKAMAVYGDKRIAASSLIKMKYYELYEWEKGTYDTGCDMEKEEYDTNSLDNDVQKFREAVQLNAEKWNTLINNEILARTATHPTLKMRLESIGADKPEVLYPESCDRYIMDCRKATGYVTSLIAEQSKESYKEYRKIYYTESKELVENWESNGRPVITEEYGDVVDALRRLGRNTEAVQLCEKAIELLDRAGSCYAYFMKGLYLLHSFDETGIDFIYRAIETNSNYIEEGIDAIGLFCCLTGQEDHLEIYRKRAVDLYEKSRIHAEASILAKKDKLSAESLPDGMLQDIITHITSRNRDNIEKIYLVRKTVTDDFFTSAIIIKMTSDTDDAVRDKILHHTFNYLDTCSDWQFSLFDYVNVESVRVEDIDGSCVYSK